MEPKTALTIREARTGLMARSIRGQSSDASRGRQSLAELLKEARIWDAAFTEQPVLPGDLSFTQGGLRIAGEVVPLSGVACKKLITQAKAPAWYFAKRSAQLRAVALQEHLNEGAFGQRPCVIRNQGSVATIARGELVDLSFSEVLGATLEVSEQRGEPLFVARIGVEEQRIEVELVSATQVMDVRPGDVIQAGVEIIHERYGSVPTQIHSFVYRLVCSNGQTRKECGANKDLTRARRLPVTMPNARELQMDEIRRLVRQTLQGMGQQMEELRRSAERPADVPELLLRWLQRARISPRAMMPRLLEAWLREGSEATQFVAINALTRVGTHDTSLSDRQRRVLSALGGLLAFSHVHICPRCFSVLGSGSDESEDAA